MPVHAADPLSAREAGARFGQAAGAALVCNFAVTDKARALPTVFVGADRTAFDAEAGKVAALWHELNSCRTSGGPNECKVSKDRSCFDAAREIGPGGIRIPGLVEVPR